MSEESYRRCDIIPAGMVHSCGRARWSSAVLMVLTLPAFAAERRPIHPTHPIRTAYYDGQELQVEPLNPPGARSFSYGPWTFGSVVHDDKASDRRFNLYIIIPGSEHQFSGPADEFNHSVLINSDPEPGDHSAEWDVFWVVVLDPTLNADIKQERELLLLGQSYFLPGDLYELDDAPGRNLLRQFGMTSLDDLARFRRDDSNALRGHVAARRRRARREPARGGRLQRRPAPDDGARGA